MVTSTRVEDSISWLLKLLENVQKYNGGFPHHTRSGGRNSLYVMICRRRRLRHSFTHKFSTLLAPFASIQSQQFVSNADGKLYF